MFPLQQFLCIATEVNFMTFYTWKQAKWAKNKSLSWFRAIWQPKRQFDLSILCPPPHGVIRRVKNQKTTTTNKQTTITVVLWLKWTLDLTFLHLAPLPQCDGRWPLTLVHLAPPSWGVTRWDRTGDNSRATGESSLGDRVPVIWGFLSWRTLPNNVVKFFQQLQQSHRLRSQSPLQGTHLVWWQFTRFDKWAQS